MLAKIIFFTIFHIFAVEISNIESTDGTDFQPLHVLVFIL